MNRTRGFARACGLAALAVIAGAAADAKPLPNANEDAPKPLPPLQKNFPLDQTFSLRDLNGKPVSAQLDVSFKLDGAFHASGYTGCNSWSGTAYPQQNQHIVVGGFVLTKKTCDKPDLDIEHSFLRALMGTPAWDLVNGDLVLKGPGGTMRLVRSL
jgi:heat shock protein HslJ